MQRNAVLVGFSVIADNCIGFNLIRVVVVCSICAVLSSRGDVDCRAVLRGFDAVV